MTIAIVPAPDTLSRIAPRVSPGPSPSTERVGHAASRLAALAVVQEVYQNEKGWLTDADAEIPLAELESIRSSWFLARLGGEPAGVVRLVYDPSFELPSSAGLEIDAGIDLEKVARSGKFAEIGRLMISPRFRSRSTVVLALMRAALSEVVRRGYTHLLTVVFEDDPHSPYGFHTRVLGFERVGSHRHGELACASRRIILTLDIARAFERLRGPHARLVQALAGGLEGELAGLQEPQGRVAPGCRS
jgi:hypothetical protein